MAVQEGSFIPREPDLLYATFSAVADPVYRDPVWATVFGSADRAWERLSAEEAEAAAHFVLDAAEGHLVRNQLFSVATPERDEPFPVLLTFVPVYGEARAGTQPVNAVIVTGEVLAEPSTFMVSQTQRNRMETLGRMTMGIAHDFNNLLSGILGHTELLKSQPRSAESWGELGAGLRTIEQAAQDGAKLVRKIQQYIRQEKADLFEPVDLAQLVGDCVVLMRPYWYNEPRRQGISIDVQQQLEPVPPVMGSTTELREVIVNLLLNSVHAMPQGGVITFETGFDQRAGVRLRVRDTGTGMPESVRRRIFEPLFTTKGERGTGMGLSVAYGIIQEHEGTIEVQSAPGEGTTFIITMPAAGTAAASEPETPVAVEPLQARVLVVDDEAMVRTVLRKLLTLRGHTITEASSGPEALSIIAHGSFDLVFTDNAMPEMNGRQLAREIRARHPAMPIVLVSGDTVVGQPDDEVDDVIAKPFRLDDLQACIQRLLGGRS